MYPPMLTKMGPDLTGFIWNLKRLIRDGFPKGLAMSQLEEQDKKYFEYQEIPSPHSIDTGYKDWGEVFIKSQSFREWFLTTNNNLIKVRPIPERDLRAYFRLVQYTEYLAARQGAKVDGWSDLSESDEDNYSENDAEMIAGMQECDKRAMAGPADTKAAAWKRFENPPQPSSDYSGSDSSDSDDTTLEEYANLMKRKAQSRIDSDSDDDDDMSLEEIRMKLKPVIAQYNSEGHDGHGLILNSTPDIQQPLECSESDSDDTTLEEYANLMKRKAQSHIESDSDSDDMTLGEIKEMLMKRKTEAVQCRHELKPSSTSGVKTEAESSMTALVLTLPGPGLLPNDVKIEVELAKRKAVKPKPKLWRSKRVFQLPLKLRLRTKKEALEEVRKLGSPKLMRAENYAAASKFLSKSKVDKRGGGSNNARTKMVLSARPRCVQRVQPLPLETVPLRLRLIMMKDRRSPRAKNALTAFRDKNGNIMYNITTGTSYKSSKEIIPNPNNECPTCGREYSSRSNLNKHRRTQHPPRLATEPK